MLNFPVFFCLLFYIMFGFYACGEVILSGKNFSISFKDIEANFAPFIKASGERGVLYVASPLDACSPLVNQIVSEPNSTKSPFVLIIRGKCSFQDKVWRAQTAGFKAAIVYNNVQGVMISMAGEPAGVKIHAVFVSKTTGEKLIQYAAATALDIELRITSTIEDEASSFLGMILISLLAIATFFATCFFIRRHRIRREHPRSLNVREFHGLSSRLVKAMPSLIFTAVVEDNSTSSTCAICLEDYSMGERLRVLPCSHKFHATCVDAWLTSWRSFCPICKRNPTSRAGKPPASESTPLLASRSSSSSTRLPLAPPDPEAARIRASSTFQNGASISSTYPAYRSSSDLRNAALQTPDNNAFLASPQTVHSLPLSSRYASPFISNLHSASPSHIESSKSQVASAQSLPGC